MQRWFSYFLWIKRRNRIVHLSRCKQMVEFCHRFLRIMSPIVCYLSRNGLKQLSNMPIRLYLLQQRQRLLPKFQLLLRHQRKFLCGLPSNLPRMYRRSFKPVYRLREWSVGFKRGLFLHCQRPVHERWKRKLLPMLRDLCNVQRRKQQQLSDLQVRRDAKRRNL